MSILIGCVEPKPNTNTVLFNGAYINIAAISRRTDLTSGHLSRIFSGQRQPSIATAKKIAEALHISVGKFLEALEIHQEVSKNRVDTQATL